MEVFSLLSFYLDAFSYFSNNLINLRHSTLFALQNNKLSYVKK
jgi:hypothetical protein